MRGTIRSSNGKKEIGAGRMRAIGERVEARRARLKVREDRSGVVIEGRRKGRLERKKDHTHLKKSRKLAMVP